MGRRVRRAPPAESEATAVGHERSRFTTSSSSLSWSRYAAAMLVRSTLAVLCALVPVALACSSGTPDEAVAGSSGASAASAGARATPSAGAAAVPVAGASGAGAPSGSGGAASGAAGSSSGSGGSSGEVAQGGTAGVAAQGGVSGQGGAMAQGGASGQGGVSGQGGASAGAGGGAGGAANPLLAKFSFFLTPVVHSKSLWQRERLRRRLALWRNRRGRGASRCRQDL